MEKPVHSLEGLKREVAMAKRHRKMPRYDKDLQERCVSWHFGTGQRVGKSARQLGLTPMTLQAWVKTSRQGESDKPRVRALRVVRDEAKYSSAEDQLGDEIIVAEKEKSLPRFSECGATVDITIGARVSLRLPVEQLDLAMLRLLAEV